jgi:hypothetical protein
MTPGRRRPPYVRAPRDPGNPHGLRTGNRAVTDGGAAAVTLTIYPSPLPCHPPKIRTERADQRIPPSRLTPRRNRRPVGRSYFRAEQAPVRLAASLQGWP